MEKLKVDEKKSQVVIPTINSLIDQVDKLEKTIDLLKGILLDNFEDTGYLEDLGLKRKKVEKVLDI